MEKIERPKQVSKLDKQILTKKNFEENTDKQINNIYDKVDEIVDLLNEPEEEPESIVFSEVLWTNSSPTASFGAKTISLKSNSYKYFRIFYRNSKSNAVIYDKTIRPRRCI